MREIQLTRGKVALVDDEDYERVRCFSWQAVRPYKCWYVLTTYQIDGRKSTVHMHTLIYGRPLNGLEIDHIDRKGLDNRRNNIRFVTPSKNNENRRTWGTVPAKGVCKHGSGYSARVIVDGKERWLGTFPTVEEAREAHNRAVTK